MKLEDLQDKHKGKIGFAVGSGPSLRKQDVSKLADYVTISVNSSIPKVQFADYFLADDIGVSHWNYYRDLLPNLYATCLLFRGKLHNKAYHLNKEKIIWFNHKTWYCPEDKSYHPEGLVFTKEADKPIIGARTSLASAIHFLYIMGCDPIVLLGCDCCYEGKRRYYWQFPGEIKCVRNTGEPVFSTPNKGMIKGRPVDSHSVDFLKYWKALAEQADKQGIKIIDASNGLLECFERMDYEEVFEKFGDRRK